MKNLNHWIMVVTVSLMAGYIMVGTWSFSIEEIDSIALDLSRVEVVAQTVCDVGDPRSDPFQIQKVVNNCDNGVVRLKNKAVYTSGTIELGSNMTLDLNNATIQVTDNDDDLFSCKGSSSRNFFVCADTKNNVKVIGPGTLVKPAGRDFDTSMIEFWNSSNILVKDVVFDSTKAPGSASGFHLVSSASNNVVFDSITIMGRRRRNGSDYGNDGIDIQSSQNVVVKNCDINTADDGVAIASSDGSNEDTLNVTVENCRIASDTAALKIGTGSMYDFDNIYYNNITVHDSAFGVRVAIVDGGTVGNVIYNNVTFESDVTRWWVCGGGTGSSTHDDSQNCVRQVDRGEGLTDLGYLHNFTLDNIKVRGGIYTGNSNSYEGSINSIDKVTFKNIKFFSEAGSPPLARFHDVCGLSISDITYPDSTIVPASEYDDLSDSRIFTYESGISNLVVDGSDPICTGSPPGKVPPSVECNDNKDNDRDGLIDLKDPGCDYGGDTSEDDEINPPSINSCGSHTPDLVCTGAVDATDLGSLLSDWGKGDMVGGDLNCDDTVDVIDFGIMMSWWGTYGGSYWDNRCLKLFF